MKNVAVVGAQWGDEGKGKVVDILAPHFDIVARYQGGHNAGHTVRIGERKFVLHLIPSGILHPECLCVIGNGTVVEPRAFKTEIDELADSGIHCKDRLFVSDRAQLILPYHTALESTRERKLGDNRVGTTMRGIGPAYEDKAGRRGIRAGDLLYPDLLREQVKLNVENANRELKSVGEDTLDAEKMLDEFLKEARVLEPYIRDTTTFLNKSVKSGSSVLLEGAQGTMLDVDHGTYPFVTSSSATSGGSATGTGLSPKLITGVLGLAKAYTTRVGGGPFPTELLNETGKYLQKRGNEYGASTGRPRRTGWFDAVVVRYSVIVNGLDAIALPKLDVLDEIDEVQICKAYKRQGKIIDDIPYSAHVLAECEPVYETLPGWKCSTSGITDYDKLPEAAKRYVQRIEELTGAPIGLISTGPERDETIIREGSAVAKWMQR
ncbi:MAG: adenylosuccinate synthase [Blastocatellia bacterium]